MNFGLLDLDLYPLYIKIREFYNNDSPTISQFMYTIRYYAILNSDQPSFEGLPEIFDSFYQSYLKSIDSYINSYTHEYIQDLVPYRSLIISKYLGLNSIENTVKIYDDIVSSTINSSIMKIPNKIKSYVGLALCHRKEDVPLEKRFEELKGLDIKWIYVDLGSVPNDNQLNENIYNGDTFKKCKNMEPDGYDFVVMSFYISYMDELFYIVVLHP